MTKDEFSIIAAGIPHQPGCYKYYDAHNELLYVGKAKDLRKRVSSYFNKTVANYKTTKLVMAIDRIEYTVTNTEHDAFLLDIPEYVKLFGAYMHRVANEVENSINSVENTNA